MMFLVRLRDEWLDGFLDEVLTETKKDLTGDYTATVIAPATVLDEDTECDHPHDGAEDDEGF